MPETLKGFIPIEPKPWKRPGDRKRKGGRYNASKADERAFLDMCCATIGWPENPPEGDVVLSCQFVLSKRPQQSWPDLSNLIKLIEDALEGVYYKNDRQICSYGEMSREFSSNPDMIGTYIEIIYV